MDDSETKDEKVDENNDVLDVDSLDSFPSLPTTGSQKSADDIEKESKQKNTCVDTHDDNLAKGTSTVPTGKFSRYKVVHGKISVVYVGIACHWYYVPVTSTYVYVLRSRFFRGDICCWFCLTKRLEVR